MPRYKSRPYLITEIMPGMKTSRDVTTEDGKIALSEGIVLTAQLIERLKYWDISCVDVYEPVDEDGIEVQPLSAQQQFFDQYAETIRSVRKAFDNVRFGRQLPVNEMVELVNQTIEPMLKSVGIVNHLHMVRRQDDYTFHHSVNVGVIAGILAKWLGYSEKKIREIVLTGILHDVGKTQIPLEILNKPGQLTADEMAVMMRHTSLGYHLVRSIPGIPSSIGYGVLEHHERMDGTGYPLGIVYDKIHPYAKLIAVADIYDAMTSDRVYHRKISPFKVAEMIVDEMLGKLDPEICAVFLNNVRDYFIGNVVELNDGREGEVVYLGRFIASRPVVRTSDGEFLDLEKQQEFSIVKLLRA